MTVAELHPDELLWREACGTLTTDERANLTAHLERCPACVLERVVRMEAARARVPSEADHAIAARLVDRVLATHDHARLPIAAGRAGRGRPLALAAAAIVLVAGTAFGATALVTRVRAHRAAPVDVVTPGRPAPAHATSRQRQMDTDIEAESEAPPAQLRGARVVSPPRVRRLVREPARSQPRATRAVALAYAGTESRAPSARAEAPAPSARPAESVSAPPPAPAPVESAPPVVKTQPEAPPQLEASQILRRAEQARTARQWADAGRAFAELGRRYAGTREELVGRALYGQLLLDHLDEPRRALTMFERYLAVDSSGALAEEARLGRAQALRRLERPDEERSAWSELLRRHPGSIHAATARARLAALDTP